MDNRHFDKSKTRWTFIALSDGIALDAEEDVNQRDRQPGHVASGKNHDVWVRTWAEVIQTSKIRLNWLQERLNIAVSSNSEGITYLHGKFGHLLPNEVTDLSESPDSETEDDETSDNTQGINITSIPTSKKHEALNSH